MYGRCHYLIGDPVRFLFVDIPRLVYREFGLQTKPLVFAALHAFSTRNRVIATRSAFAL
jgi:hypothetical protein